MVVPLRALTTGGSLSQHITSLVNRSKVYSQDITYIRQIYIFAIYIYPEDMYIGERERESTTQSKRSKRHERARGDDSNPRHVHGVRFLCAFTRRSLGVHALRRAARRHVAEAFEQGGVFEGDVAALVGANVPVAGPAPFGQALLPY